MMSRLQPQQDRVVVPADARLRLRQELRRHADAPHAPAAGPSSDLVEITLALRRQSDPTPPEGSSERLPGERHSPASGGPPDFGAFPEDMARVEQFAREQGLEVVEKHGDAAMVMLRGSPDAVRSALGLEEGEHVCASLPSPLGDCVRWIFGLDDRRLHCTPFPFEAPSAPKDVLRVAGPGERQPTSYPATEVARLYDYPELQGDGQCLGLIELGGGVLESDLAMYFRALGVKPPKLVYVGPNEPGPNPVFNLEVTLDVEIAAAVCPRARIVVYNAQDVSVHGYLTILRRAIFDEENKPSVLSVSWSFPELPGEGPTRAEALLFDELFACAARRGITICSSCGDRGALTPLVSGGSATSRPAANFAASSPYVLGCGGTTLEVADGAIREETVWNRLLEPMLFLAAPDMPEHAFPFPMATGGGISRLFELPDYQRAAEVPPLIERYWSFGKLEKTVVIQGRGTPDVAANADWMTGYQIAFLGQWNSIGGTSAAAPMWAALITLLNEGLAANHGVGVTVGWLNPLLYAMRLRDDLDVCRAITRGNNGGYEARPDLKWNPCTGLGSPRGKALAAALGAWPIALAQQRMAG